MKTAFRAPPTTCSGAASEARAVIRLLREAAARNDPCPRRVRVELPLPLADLDSDALAFAGLHGQASDWSGGIDQRFRVTKGLIDAFVLDGYENEYLGLLDRDADGMGVWKIGGSNSGGAHDATLVTHPSDTTAGFFLKLLDGAYGARVAECDHLVIVVNAFWSGSGERVGQPWEFALRRRAREVLSVKPDEKREETTGRRCIARGDVAARRGWRERCVERGPVRGACSTQRACEWCSRPRPSPPTAPSRRRSTRTRTWGTPRGTTGTQQTRPGMTT